MTGVYNEAIMHCDHQVLCKLFAKTSQNASFKFARHQKLRNPGFYFAFIGVFFRFARQNILEDVNNTFLQSNRMLF